LPDDGAHSLLHEDESLTLRSLSPNTKCCAFKNTYDQDENDYQDENDEETLLKIGSCSLLFSDRFNLKRLNTNHYSTNVQFNKSSQKNNFILQKK